MSISKREYVDLWIAISTVLVVVAYHLFVHLSDSLPDALAGSRTLPVATLITNGLFFWLLGLMWFAFRRWKGTCRREAELSDIIASAEHEVVMVVDPDRTIIMCNDTVKDVFGYDVDELIHQKADVLYGDDQQSHLGRLEDGLKQMGFCREEAVGKTKSGEDVILEIATASLKKGGGAVLMCQDITERKQAEDAIRAAKDELEAANLAKDRVLAELEESYSKLRELESMRDSLVHMVIHDMKTPLQVLVLQVQHLKMMAGKKLDADEHESLDNVLTYVRQLNTMTTSMLDLSRLESGKLPLKLRLNDLNNVVREASHYLDSMATDCSMEIDCPSSLSPLDFDAEVVHRIVTNLLTNAIKYSPKNGVILVEVRDVGDRVRVSVTDQGPGIDVEDLPQIFDKFSQVKSAKQGSSGLGLTFCKLAVEAHGGQIEVESEIGMGTTAWFTLPRDPRPETQIKEPELAGTT